MNTTKEKDKGLAAIARSSRTAAHSKPTLARSTGDAKPPLELEGRNQNTSLTLDVGLANCLADLAHIINKRARRAGRHPVSYGKIMEAAFMLFHDLPLEKQMEMVEQVVR
jgi:hypothetical protein